MAAVITSVVPTPVGFPEEASIVINGTGFGASPGILFLAFPDYGQVFEYGVGTWTATALSDIFLPNRFDFQDQGITFPTSAFFVVVPLGSDVGGRSTVFTIVLSTTPIVSFPDDTLIVAGPTATAEGDFGPQTPPATFPLRTALGRTNGFDNPGYDVKWVEFNTNDQAYEFNLDGFTQTDFSLVGTSVQRNLEQLGIFVPLING